jgi:hypothetical protein
MISHTAVETAKVVTEAPEPDQGETIVSPKPEPSSIRMKVRVHAAKAPAMIGPQLTAVEEDSVEGGTSTPDRIGCIVAPYRAKSMMRMIIGIGMPSSQSKIPRPMRTPVNALPRSNNSLTGLSFLDPK